MNEFKKMQKLAGLINEAEEYHEPISEQKIPREKLENILSESKMKIYGRVFGTESTVDLNLIDKLAKQIGPATEYSDWEERIADIDYESIIQSFAKQILGLGVLQNDRIKFKK